MALSYTPSASNQRPAGFKRVFIKTGAEKWQSLGFIKDGELSFASKSETDSLMRNLAYCAEFKATFKMLQTGKTVELPLIDDICNGTNSFLFEMVDADTTNDQYIYVTNVQVGASAKLVIDGDPNSIRYIEITVSGSVLLADFADVTSPTVETTDFQVANTSGGTYALIGSTGTTGAWTTVNLGNKDRMLPSGISQIEVQDANATTYVALGKIKGAKLECDFIGETDSMMRPQTYAVDISLEYEHLETLKTGGLDTIGGWAQKDIDVKATCFDGTVFTMASKLGFDTNYSVSGNMDKFSVIKQSHKGRIVKTAFSAMIS